MHHNSKIIASLNWLSSKNKYKGYDLIEEAEQRNLKFMEILKRYGFELYEHTFIAQLFKKINAIKHFVYNKSVEYIADLPDYATYDLKMMKAYNATGILRVNFTVDEMIKEANELSLSEVSLLLNKIKFWLPDTTLNKNQKFTITIEPVADYFLNQFRNEEISVVVLIKKKGLFSQPFELTRVSIPIIGKTDYDIENSLRKVILLTKFYLFLDDIKWELLAGVIEEDKCQAN